MRERAILCTPSTSSVGALSNLRSMQHLIRVTSLLLGVSAVPTSRLQSALTEIEHLLEPEMAMFEKEAGLPSSHFQDVIVAKHNELRAQNCAPPLVWDDDLAKAALKCAKACPLTHKSKGGPAVCDTKGTGENLAWAGTTGTPKESEAAWEDPIQAWYDEHVDYDFKTGKSKNGKAGAAAQGQLGRVGMGRDRPVGWERRVGCRCARPPEYKISY